MKLFQATLQYEIDHKEKTLTKIFKPWLKRRNLIDWTQQLHAIEISDENKILFNRAGRGKGLDIDIWMNLEGNKLSILIKPNSNSYIYGNLMALIIAIFILYKNLHWVYFFIPIGIDLLFTLFIIWSIGYEKDLVRKDIWQELHIQKIKFEEIKG